LNIQKLSDLHSVSTNIRKSYTFDDFGQFFFQYETRPQKYDKKRMVLHEIMAFRCNFASVIDKNLF